MPGQTEHTPGTIEEQTEQTLRNVAAVLEAGGSSLSHALQMTIYVSDISLWGRVNATYARVMGDAKPTRAVVPVRPPLRHIVDSWPRSAARATAGRSSNTG